MQVFMKDYLNKLEEKRRMQGDCSTMERVEGKRLNGQRIPFPSLQDLDEGFPSVNKLAT